MNKGLFGLTPRIEEFSKLSQKHNAIEKDLYVKYDVKQGLRDSNGAGVLTGLTNISDVCAKEIVDGKTVPCAGNLYYRGYNIKDLVHGFEGLEDFGGFEEAAYLLLFGELPTQQKLNDFRDLLVSCRRLPPNFVRDIIMKAPSRDMMNSLSRSILSLYTYDPYADDTSLENVMRQCINLIAQFPMLMVYGYHAYNYHHGQDLYIYSPKPELSTAENILMMLREDRSFSQLEAKVLDMAMVLHMDHGGGNNSTFTTHVVTSSGTDTYSTIAAALASLKGPKHGGANIKVIEMFDAIKSEVADWEDEEEVTSYLEAILNKEAFDRKGLIYGIGHAVYTVSDPRAEVLEGYVQKLAAAKGYDKEYSLYKKVERIAPKLINDRQRTKKGVNANVDFYSGLVYHMLGLPSSLYTPIFATARIVGWSAHRLEELQNVNRIIRPAYMPLAPHKEYIPIDQR